MRILKKNKKGFLLGEETLKMLVAIICIVFLVYLLVAIYKSTSGDKKIGQASEVFFGENGIQDIISMLKDGESQERDIIDPSGWHLYSFVGEERPNSCLNQRCLCICERALIQQFKSQAKKCDDKGKCMPAPKLASSDIDLKIRGAEDALFIKIVNQNGRIFIEELR
jgi:hypothetical protein